MTRKKQSKTTQPARVPKEGRLFETLATIGLLAKTLGILTLIAAGLGLIYVLFRAVTSYSSFVGVGQATDEIYFSIVGIYLGTFAGVGLLGGLFLGIGHWLDRVSAKKEKVK